MIDIGLNGLQEAQEAILRAYNATKPSGGLGRAVSYAAQEAYRYAVAITHVWIVRGGWLRASHRIKPDGTARARIFVDPNAINARTGSRVLSYAAIEEARGGSHSFYGRVVTERGSAIADAALEGLQKGL